MLALQALGITATEVGEPFRCVLPGHSPDEAASASIWRDRRESLYKYRDWHHAEYGSDEWFRLCDVRAARATGQLRWLRKPEATVWYRRLWCDAGLIEPRPVELPELPPDATADMIAVAKGFSLLVGLRRWTHNEPTPFTHRFVGPWCDLPGTRGVDALRELVGLEVIRCVGELPTVPRPTPLYEPGVRA